MSSIEGKDACRILKETPSGPTLADHSESVVPEPALVASSVTLAGARDGLARRTCRNEVNARERTRIKCSNVVMDRGFGPMSFQDQARVRLNLAMANGSEPGPFGCEGHTAHAREQVEVSHRG